MTRIIYYSKNFTLFFYYFFCFLLKISSIKCPVFVKKAVKIIFYAEFF